MSGCCKSCKNPCMVCKRTVTTKTGLQCQGSCKSWIHFTCCSYTPGKIKDIKAKVIKVRCPCPDCSTQGPKEVIVKDSSFTCINKTCPINNPPKCTNQGCPTNRLSQQTSTCEPPKGPRCPKCPEWPGMPCGVSCKKNAREEDIGDRCNQPRPYKPPCPPPPSCPGPPCPPPPPVCPGVVCAPPPCPPPSCPPPPCPPPPCLPPPCPPPPCPPPPCPPPPCPGGPPPCSPPAPVMPSISIVENMCETVGLLSDQLNQLMCKMTDVLAPKGQGTPCRCPQNPRR